MTKYLVLFLSTSIDQMGAELVAWFGVSATEVKTDLRNVCNFELYKLVVLKGQKHENFKVDRYGFGDHGSIKLQFWSD